MHKEEKGAKANMNREFQIKRFQIEDKLFAERRRS